MSYVQPLSKANAPQEAKPVLEAIEKKLGATLNIFQIMAYQPEILAGVATIDAGLRKDLPGRLRELAYVISSRINGCGYCSHYHRQAAEGEGITDSQLDEILDHAHSDSFSDEEKAVLAYAEQLTKTAEVDPAVVQELKGFLNETQLVTLAATVALANFTNRFNHGLDIELP